MPFADRLTALRKQRGLTQQALADELGVHVTQIRRYEAGASVPHFEVLKKLIVALGVASDDLLFDSNERGPDEELRLHFEAARRLGAHEKALVKGLLDAVLRSHDSKREGR